MNFPSHTPACHPGAFWLVGLDDQGGDIGICSTCGRSDAEQKRGGFEAQAGLQGGHPSGLPESKDQLYRAILAIVMEPDDEPMKERMLHWAHLSAAFWHYQHVLWGEAKAQNYWSPKWEVQRKYSRSIIDKAAGKPDPTAGLSLADLGL